MHQAKAELDRRLIDLRESGEASGAVHLRADLDMVPPLDWLISQPHSTRLYGAQRDQGGELAGCGIADQVFCQHDGDLGELVRELQTRLARFNRETLYLGGLTFLPPSDEIAPEWQPFGRLRFILPRWIVQRSSEADTSSLHLHLVWTNADERRKKVDLCRRELAEMDLDPLSQSSVTTTVTHPLTRQDHPEEAEWNANIERALDMFERHDAEKVVFARRSDFTFAEAPDPFSLLARLKAKTPHCFHYCMQLSDDAAFLGATPEMLYARMGRNLLTEAVAGTRRRGVTETDDQALADDLLSATKDRHEHGLVANALTEALSGLAHTVQSDDVSVLKLHHLQHLCQHFQAVLNDDVTDADLLTTLHPTPAVGGWPTEVALEQIREFEPFFRGWYAAPIGWISQDSASFAVAIRCGLLRDRTLSLFAGAGIVTGSNAAAEWQELEDKLGNFLNGII